MILFFLLNDINPYEITLDEPYQVLNGYLYALLDLDQICANTYLSVALAS